MTDDDYLSTPTSCGVGACASTGSTSCVGGSVIDSCAPGSPTTEICDGSDDDCDGTVDNGFSLGGVCTVGVGACQATGVIVCSADHLSTMCSAIPGTPTAEVCDGIDNNCDGSIDEGAIQVSATCSINPATLNVNANGPSFTMGVSLYNACGGGQIPLDATQLGPAYISRAADIMLPDPTALTCSDPFGERGIVDNPADRSASGNSATLRFNLASDGLCSTLDGNRQDLNALLAGVPDNTSAQVCVAGRISGATFECCVNPNVRNRGLR
jgi:hypothetical protein